MIAIAANKQDLRKKQVVSTGESEAYAESIKALHFGTSAKTGDGLPDVFQAIATTVVARLPTSGAAVGPLFQLEQCVNLLSAAQHEHAQMQGPTPICQDARPVTGFAVQQ